MSEDLEQSVNHLTDQVEILVKQISVLSEVVVRLARMEEKAINMEKDVDGYGNRLSRFEDKFTKQMTEIRIKTAVQANSGSMISRWVERLIVFIVLAALTSWGIFK